MENKGTSLSIKTGAKAVTELHGKNKRQSVQDSRKKNLEGR